MKRRASPGAANAAQAAMTDVMFSGIGIAGAILLIFVLARRPLIPPAESTTHVDVVLQRSNDSTWHEELTVVVWMPGDQVFSSDATRIDRSDGPVQFQELADNRWSVIFRESVPVGTVILAILANVSEAEEPAMDYSDTPKVTVESLFPTESKAQGDLQKGSGFARAFVYKADEGDSPPSWNVESNPATTMSPTRGASTARGPQRQAPRPPSRADGEVTGEMYHWDCDQATLVKSDSPTSGNVNAAAWEQDTSGKMVVWRGPREDVEWWIRVHNPNTWRYRIEAPKASEEKTQSEAKSEESHCVAALIRREKALGIDPGKCEWSPQIDPTDGAWSEWRAKRVSVDGDTVTVLTLEKPEGALLDNGVVVIGDRESVVASIEPGVLDAPSALPKVDWQPPPWRMAFGMPRGSGTVCVVKEMSGQGETGKQWTWQWGTDNAVTINTVTSEVPWWLIRKDNTLVAADVAQGGPSWSEADVMMLAAMSFEECRKHGFRQNPRLRVAQVQ